MPAKSLARRSGSDQAEDNRRLRDLAGVGPVVEADLKALRVNSVSKLAESDGDELYHRLCEIKGARQDPCVLDGFRCAVAQARDPRLPSEQRNWWWWSRQRKAGRLP
ncbi:MAG: helix-hairpin-helix domain-containing protein [Bryobacteraceae bacterium]